MSTRPIDVIFGELITETASRVTSGYGPFGAAVLLPEGETISGFNSVTISHDPTAHAEINAIRAACALLGSHSLAGATLLATSEPCPMCLTAAMWARLDHVYYAATIADAAAAGFDDTAFYQQVSEGPADFRYTHIPHPDRLLPFTTWTEYDEKVPY
ncbi:nucleoside deaminase [Flaviflexus huanghaiensis]|uniref:nucleoside deaminase n=1 Tax=Flaviflexus huanghaiensis TaxID=1111473 RepID=UPI0015FD4E75|nr:nucleoside deaminase [Flaviflexus huanghaiensis]